MVKLQEKLIIKFRTEKEWNKILKLLPDNHSNSSFSYKRFRDSHKYGDLQILIRSGIINGFGTAKSYPFREYSPKEYLFINIKEIGNKIIEIW